jgi:hypothetical protein
MVTVVELGGQPLKVGLAQGPCLRRCCTLCRRESKFGLVRCLVLESPDDRVVINGGGKLVQTVSLVGYLTGYGTKEQQEQQQPQQQQNNG